MNDACPELAPLLAADRLGVLEDEGRARVAAHLATGCLECRDLALDLGRALARAECPPVPAPAGVRARLLEQIVADRAAASGAPALVVRLSCTYCHGSLVRKEAAFCGGCLAPCHEDCFEAHGRCAAPGCSETTVVRPSGRRPRRGPWGAALFTLAGAGAIAALVVVETRPGTPPAETRPLAPSPMPSLAPAPPPAPSPPPPSDEARRPVVSSVGPWPTVLGGGVDPENHGYWPVEPQPVDRVAWTYSVALSTAPVQSQCLSMPLPSVSGRIYVRTLTGAIHCVDARTGVLLWGATGGVGGSPSVTLGPDEVSYSCLDREVRALDRNGAQLWRRDTAGDMHSPPRLSPDGRTLVLVADSGNVRIDAATGQAVVPRAARLEDGSLVMPATACFDATGELVFATTGAGAVAQRADGHVSWTARWSAADSPPLTSFLAARDVVVAARGDRVEILRAGGTEACASFRLPGPVTGLALSEKNEVVVSTEVGVLVGLSLETGAEVWRQEVSGRPLGPPATCRGGRIVVCERTASSVAGEPGAKAYVCTADHTGWWGCELPSPAGAWRPSVGPDGRIYVAGSQAVYCLEAGPDPTDFAARPEGDRGPAGPSEQRPRSSDAPSPVPVVDRPAPGGSTLVDAQGSDPDDRCTSELADFVDFSKPPGEIEGQNKVRLGLQPGLDEKTGKPVIDVSGIAYYPDNVVIVVGIRHAKVRSFFEQRKVVVKDHAFEVRFGPFQKTMPGGGLAIEAEFVLGLQPLSVQKDLLVGRFFRNDPPCKHDKGNRTSVAFSRPGDEAEPASAQAEKDAIATYLKGALEAHRACGARIAAAGTGGGAAALEALDRLAKDLEDVGGAFNGWRATRQFVLFPDQVARLKTLKGHIREANRARAAAAGATVPNVAPAQAALLLVAEEKEVGRIAGELRAFVEETDSLDKQFGAGGK